MAYVVKITARAERDLEHIYSYIEAASSNAAYAWFTELAQKTIALEKMPNRNPVTPENPKLRHMLYGKKPDVYRIIYCVEENLKQVEIIHIRHGAMKRLQIEVM